MNELKNVVVLQLDVHTWTGRKKLSKADLKNVTDEQIPPDTLASLGSKRIYNPDELLWQERLKTRAERACLAVGTRFLGGYAVPVAKLDELVNELTSIRDEWNVAKEEFLDNYTAGIDAWVDANPEWAHIIRKAVTPINSVRNRIHFSFITYKVDFAGGADLASDINSGLAQQASSLGERLFIEIAQKATQTWEASFRGRQAITRRALRPIQAMRDKLDGLSFVDPRVYPVVERIDQVLADLPKTGAIEGSALSSVEGVLLMLTDPERMKRHGEAVLNDGDSLDADALVAEADDNTFVTVTAPAVYADGKVGSMEDTEDLFEADSEASSDDDSSDSVTLPATEEATDAYDWF